MATALANMGTAAIPAAGELTVALGKARTPLTQKAIAQALSNMGPAAEVAVPALTTVLKRFDGHSTFGWYYADAFINAWGSYRTKRCPGD